MTFKWWGWTLKAPALVAGLLLSSCGIAEDSPVEEHEKVEAEASATLAGWQLQPVQQASVHPLGHQLKETVEIEGPDTARKLRLRFSSIRMENGYDFLIIQDENGNEVERVTGNHRNYLSRTIQGRKARVVLETDDSVASWGFSLDQLRFRGCAHNPPGDLALRKAESCTDLLAAIRGLAVKEVRRRFTDSYFGRIVPMRGAQLEGDKAAPAHSETNLQVDGVDEADIVKTDGNWIYTISGRELRIYRSWPAAAAELVHRVTLEGWPKEMFVEGTRLIVLSGVQGDFAGGPIGPRPPVFTRMPIWWRADAFTKVTVLEFTGEAPTVKSELLLSGQYNTARRTGTAVRLVVNRELKWPELRYWPDGIDATSPEFEKALDALEAEAIQRVEARSLADWLPDSYRVANGQRQLLPTICEDFAIPTGADEPGLTSVVTIDVGGREPVIQDTSLLVRAEQLYQSLDNLYLTSQHSWQCWEDAGREGQFTYLHQLDVSNALRTTYRASGGVPGNVLDQFAMDEHDRHLRVATTTNRWSAPTPEEQNTNQVFVLSRRGSRLEVVGQTPIMAPGERIYSSRFVGDTGYVVTFRQVDPLFVIDLATPSAPRILGELKVPGFSTYLHVLDAQHLFTIGQDFAEDGTTRNGVALSIFDVSDRAHPRLSQKTLVGTTHGHSEALYEHKAFTMYRAPGAADAVLAIPFTDWTVPAEDAGYWGTFISSLKVFRVSPTNITSLGELDVSDFFSTNGENGWGWWYLPNIRRGVFVDQYVYAVADSGVKAAAISDLTRVVARAPAPPQVETPTPEPQIVTAEAGADPNAAIPDNNARGVASTVTVDHSFAISRLTVDLNVKHPYVGDLKVTLSHDGVVETLHDRTGGSTDNIVRTFVTERFVGLNVAGDWTLQVVDAARADQGELSSWKMLAVGKEEGGTAPTLVNRTFEAKPLLAIPDNDNLGVVSELEVPEGISITSLELSVDITHSYRGDLVVTLEHDGVTATMHDRSGGSSDNLHLSVPVEQFVGRDARGAWRLRVADVGARDVGTFDAWRLELRGNLR